MSVVVMVEAAWLCFGGKRARSVAARESRALARISVELSPNPPPLFSLIEFCLAACVELLPPPFSCTTVEELLLGMAVAAAELLLRRR